MSEEIFPDDLIEASAEICRNLGMATTPTNCMPIVKGLLADRQRDQWQPMSTAPRDGTPILVRSKDWPEEPVVVVKFFNEDIMNPYVWARLNGDEHFLNAAFSGWQPLPAAPKGE